MVACLIMPNANPITTPIPVDIPNVAQKLFVNTSSPKSIPTAIPRPIPKNKNPP